MWDHYLYMVHYSIKIMGAGSDPLNCHLMISIRISGDVSFAR